MESNEFAFFELDKTDSGYRYKQTRLAEFSCSLSGFEAVELVSDRPDSIYIDVWNDWANSTEWHVLDTGAAREFAYVILDLADKAERISKGVDTGVDNEPSV